MEATPTEWDLNHWNWDGHMFLAKPKLTPALCQVDHCTADLTTAKDYHRRHKVCEIHSKAPTALVSDLLQRFCQQCSRFHPLPDFDQAKRSCRRRLAGHNKRRRKTALPPAPPPLHEQHHNSSNYLLVTLLRILSNIHTDRSTDQDLLSHLLTTLASQSKGTSSFNDASTSDVVSTLLQTGSRCPPRPTRKHQTLNASEMPPQKKLHLPSGGGVSVHTTSSMNPGLVDSTKMNNFDLNDIYIDSDEDQDQERSPQTTNLVTNSADCPSWVQQETSGNSDSASAQSPSSSTGEAQSRTDRIVFKLFGKDPNDFPLVLRAQILDWLSNTPSDIESYIRPGCVILTIYLRQSEAAWEELCCDLGSSLTKLLDDSDNMFWRSGWVFVRAQHQIAFVCNGEIVVDTSLPLRSNNHTKIVSVKPIAVSASEDAQFLVRGINLAQSTTRLFCALEGEYLFQEAIDELMDTPDDVEDDDRCISFSCPIPVTNGRGFVEIEDEGLGSSYFPFIVAEEEVCSEIRMLESALECMDNDDDVGGSGKTDTYNQAVDFLHEMGWLLHRSQVRSRLGRLDPNAALFPLKRFKWLMEFSVDHDWSAVVRKLLDVLHDGNVGEGDDPSLSVALSEIGLLHRAVRRNSRALVEALLKYTPKNSSANVAVTDTLDQGYLFRPDAVGPAGLTPLHIAAGKDGSEEVLDALTNDPGLVGVKAWKSARDSTGSTPEDYARLRGHYSYIRLVQRKIHKRPASGHVVVDIPDALDDCTSKQKQNEVTRSFEIGRAEVKRACKLCDRKVRYGTRSMSMAYRPTMLSMMAVAAVCVCVALLFKSSPEVMFVFQPFRWERLEFGTS